VPIKVEILAVGEVHLPVGVMATKRMRSITYSADGAMPRIVYVEPDKDTPEERRRLIAEDVKRAAAETRPTLELP
jgi:hypothetical protein